MKQAGLVWRNLSHSWRTHLPLGLAVAVCVAVIVGSLLVGTSVRATLRRRALARLGEIEAALWTQHLFYASQAQHLQEGLDKPVIPLVALQGQAHVPNAAVVAPRVNVYAVGERFSRAFPAHPLPDLGKREAAISPALADALDVRAGDTLLLRVPRQSRARPETVFARYRPDQTMRALRLTVKTVLPAKGPGALALQARTEPPRNLYVDALWFTETMDMLERANMMLLLKNEEPLTEEELERLNFVALPRLFLPEELGFIVTFEENGLTVKSRRFVFGGNEINAFSQAAARMFLPMRRYAFHLANRIEPASGKEGARAIPYAMVMAADGLSPEDGGSRRQMKLIPWAQEDLRLDPGETVRLHYWGAETGAHLVEKTLVATFADTQSAEESELKEWGKLAPDYPGMDPHRPLENWQLPFPIDLEAIRPRDEAFWERYGTAPKAILSFDALGTMWRTPNQRLGGVTALRMEYPPDVDPPSNWVRMNLMQALNEWQLIPRFRPVRHEALLAARGSTDFAQLFLALGCFLIVAAAALIALLFRLLIETRMPTLGLLAAVGWSPRSVRLLLLAEGVLLSLLATLVGAGLGAVYAKAMIMALGSVWTDAVGGIEIRLDVGTGSLLTGALAGLLVSLGSMAWALRVLKRKTPLAMLRGELVALAGDERRRPRWAEWVRVLLLMLLAGLGILTLKGAVSQVLGFVLLGIIGLSGALLGCWAEWRGPPRIGGRLGLAGMALRNLHRHPFRSIATMTPLACASFLLVTVAAHRLVFSSSPSDAKQAGNGGFAFIVELSLPLPYVPSSAADWRDLGVERDVSEEMGNVQLYALRESDGTSADCRNLNKPQQPRVLGVPQALIEYNGFAFAETMYAPGEKTPWQRLADPFPDGSIPMITDAATARYILGVDIGKTLAVPGANGKTLTLRLVGTLERSIFQGDLLIHDEAFALYFGDEGYRRLLVRPWRQVKPQKLRATLAQALRPYGPAVRSTREILTRYARVQNTYLSAFTVLGGLGLLLGTFGTAVVLLRNAFERRRELALLRAVGYGRLALVRLLLIENVTLLLYGLFLGGLAALAASTPSLVQRAAAPNWLHVGAFLLLALLAGTLACAVGAWAVTRGRLLAALRSE